MKAFLAVPALALLLLSACAQAPKPVVLEKPIKSLGVASSCGRVITRESLAWLNVGMHDYTRRNVRDWGLDDQLAGIVGEKNAGAVTAVGVQVDFAKLALDRKSDLKSAITPPVQPVDAYLIVTPSTYGEPNSFTGVHDVNLRYGVGLFSRMSWRFTHVECMAVLVDAQSFRQITFDKIHRFEDAPKDLDLNTWDDYSPEQMARVRTLLTALWQQSMRDMLTRMPF